MISLDKPLNPNDVKNMSQVSRQFIIEQVLTGHKSMYKEDIDKLSKLEEEYEFSRWCVYGNSYNSNQGTYASFSSSTKSDPRKKSEFRHYMETQGVNYLFDPKEVLWVDFNDITKKFKEAYTWFKSVKTKYLENREAFAETYRNNIHMQDSIRLYALLYVWGKLGMIRGARELDEDSKEFMNNVRNYFPALVEAAENEYNFKYNFRNIGNRGSRIMCQEYQIGHMESTKRVEMERLRVSLNNVMQNLVNIFKYASGPINICLNNAIVGSLENTSDTEINIEQKVECKVEQKEETVSNGTSHSTSTNGTSTNGTSTNGTSTNGTSTNGTSHGSSTGTSGGISDATDVNNDQKLNSSNIETKQDNKLIYIGVGILLIVLIIVVVILFMKKRREKKLAARASSNDEISSYVNKS